MTGDSPLEPAIADVLAREDATAFVAVGSARQPTLRYCRPELDDGRHAVAFDGREWRVRSATDPGAAPASELADVLATDGLSGTVLTPARIPHDAALYLEDAGFSLSSTDVVARGRATKTDAERARIEDAQAAAGAGLRRGAAALATAEVVDGRLGLEDEALTAERLRIAIDEAIVAAGGFPDGNTTVSTPGDGPVRPGEPVVLEAAPREPSGYHGVLARTFVRDGEGGSERRAHVGITRSFRSAAAMLTADAQSVTAVEADLEAEVRAFGFEDGIHTRVAGVGLEPVERPRHGSATVESDAVARLDVGVDLADGRIRLTELVAVGDDVDRLGSIPRSLDPEAAVAD
ncbi:M24 family metallopeptidase [Natronococcus occultus]|uniref:Xaa-Pro aminopeptidase n=1 Tax=Natronococcus occultus SP4 TaxID=694430 RepID=L0K0K7_9EURY|nr:M24 family metallopeptidase [Natronococcus occultus]AGB37869.1 Xaa-Pro aminopeptidase [Natronococcus occultus SP4]